jgi:3-oxoacyl-[acyl-carrier protein] reductase/meso-butanediol dehydrogenase/(S,S)-butanediol dehydrogenase/diacetyl reductase
MLDLTGKVALITGAGGMKGVGRATALKLASQGADIAITDVHRAPEDLPPQEVSQQWRGLESVAEEVRALQRHCLTVPCDLSVSEQIQQLVQQVVEHYGRIDILVNNARAIIGRDRVPVTELREDVWQHFLAINTTAVFLGTKFAGQQMIRLGNGGRIINIASAASKRGSARGAAYAASKFAVLGLTQSAALDLASYGITVNAVCPGGINTDRLNYWEREQAEAQGMSLADYRAQLVAAMGRANPMGRIAESEDVANLVAFLASDEASYITGQGYNINGGALFH